MWVVTIYALKRQRKKKLSFLGYLVSSVRMMNVEARANGRIIKNLKTRLLVILGWFFVCLGLVGIVVPILPTTPFLILALAIFSKSSQRFHHMLLENKWFGPSLKRWEKSKTLPRRIKLKATLMIVISFSVSIGMLRYRVLLQLLLLSIAVVLLFFLWRIDEGPIKVQ